MKFNFKIQQYQTDAVENTVNVFAGQPSRDGFRNNDIELTDQELFANIRKMQEHCDIPLSGALSHDLGRVELSNRFSTPTAKTQYAKFSKL